WAGTNPGKGKSRDTTGPPGKPPRDPTTPTRGGGPATPRTPAGLSQPSAVPPTPRPRPPPGLARSRLTPPTPEGSPFHSLTRPSASRPSVHHRHPASSGSPPGLAARGNAAERGGPTRGPRTATGGCVSGPEQVGWLLAARRLVGGAQVGVDRLPPPPTARAGEAKPAHTHARARTAPRQTPGPARRNPPPTRRGEARATAGQEQHSAPPRGQRSPHAKATGPCPHAAAVAPRGE
uniref:Formin-like protein 20 n=1 Tax=Camelus bactrianus TaxID=9837 RepID=A0A9W3EQJ6_CAMBA